MTVDLLCMGEPMLEFNLLPPGPDGRRLYLEGHGGDTSNTAVAAARQGARVGFITALGQDAAGDSFIALWQREGIDSSTVIRMKDHPTAVYIVTHGPNGHEFLYYRAGSAAAHYTPAHLPTDAIANARMLFASGVSQAISPSAADAVFHAIDIARAQKIAVAYDTNYRPRLWPAARAAAVIHAAIAQADYALPSREDAEALTNLTDPDAILDFYLRLGPKVVALKLGQAGTYLATPDHRLRIPPFPVKAVDGTGAGDTFCGSFLARILAGDTPEQAARYAAVAAALKCTGYGAVAPMPTGEQVRAALAAA